MPISVMLKKVMCVPAKLLQLCLTLCDPRDRSPPGSSVHGILQARILEWVAIPLFGGSSQPRDRSQVSHTAGKLVTISATREVQNGQGTGKMPHWPTGGTFPTRTCVHLAAMYLDNLWRPLDSLHIHKYSMNTYI